MNPQEIRQVGRYPVRRFIAEGGMAWVFEVIDPTFDAPRALKMLKPGVAAGDQFRRFQDEARILARLEHPNLITIYDFGLDEASGCHFYTMTLVDTPPLSKRGVLPLEEAAPIFLGVLAGLARLHEGGIVHRDIKPGNILVHPDGRPMLADLGIARTADLSEGETWFTAAAGHGTSTGIAIGTPAYMSPEQARGRRGIGKSTDVFSFGLTMYNALTGRTIYEEIEQIDSTSGQDILAYLGHLSFSHEEFEFHFEPDTPDPICDVIETACRIDPEERYPDAIAMREALQQALEETGHEPVRRTPSSGPRRVASGERRASSGESRPRTRTSQRPVVPHDEEEADALPWGRIGGAGAVAVALLAAAWFAWTRVGAHVETVSLEQVAQLEQQANRILDAAGAPEAGTPAAVLAAAREKQRSAAMLLQQGRTKQEKGERADARVFLDNARQGFAESCGALVDGDLAARFGKDADDAKREAEGLAKLDVKSLAPDAFAKLEQQIAALAPPAPTLEKCPLAEAFQGRLGDVRLASAGSRALEQQLQKEWPRLAEAARGDAMRARATALAAHVPAPEFQAALERAEQLLAAGDAAVQSESFLAARDSFWKAKDAFTGAAAVTGAFQAQQSLRALAQTHEPDQAIKGEIARADGLYAAGSFDEAKAVYERASKFINDDIQKDQQSQPARIAKRAADDARAQALGQGAEKSAPEALAKADAALRDAASAYDAGRFDDAEKGYGGARAAFQGAGRQAGAELDRARKAGLDARAAAKRIGDCAALDAKQARPECLAATDTLAKGDAAVQAGDAVAALEHYGAAADGFTGAEQAQETYKKGINFPPSIVAKKPASPSYPAREGEPVHFEIEVKDPNPGDVLRYAWTVDGKRRPETGPSLDLNAQADSVVEVKVDDGHPDGIASTGWNLAVRKDVPPSIVAKKPGNPSAEAHRGEPLHFEVTVKDPDPGDALRYVWTVDGKRRPEVGPALDLTPQADSSVEVQVDDGHPEGVASASWNVAIKNRSPKLALSPAGDVRLDVGAAQAFAAQASDPDGDDVTIALLLDGKPVGDRGSYTFQGQTPGTHVLEARATDSSGAVTSLRRTISVASANQPPKLTLTPAQEAISLDVGKKQAFAAKASDPDDDDVKVGFWLDGKPVGSGDSYTFTGQREGTYVLEAKATDARGAVTSQRRRIQVAAAAPAPVAVVAPPPRPAPEPVKPSAEEAPKQPPVEQAAVKPSEEVSRKSWGDPRQIAEATLREYRAAYESRDIERLAGVWLMDPKQRNNTATFFSATNNLSISVKTGEVHVLFDQLSVEFEQTISADGIKPSSARLVATLVKSGPQWKIQRIGPR